MNGLLDFWIVGENGASASAPRLAAQQVSSEALSHGVAEFRPAYGR
jgi:hypothetical protein